MVFVIVGRVVVFVVVIVVVVVNGLFFLTFLVDAMVLYAVFYLFIVSSTSKAVFIFNVATLFWNRFSGFLCS